jgi:hypothetical protein
MAIRKKKFKELVQGDVVKIISQNIKKWIGEHDLEIGKTYTVDYVDHDDNTVTLQVETDCNWIEEQAIEILSEVDDPKLRVKQWNELIVGDKVKVVKEIHGHDFKIGEVVVVSRIPKHTDYMSFTDVHGNNWALTNTEVEILVYVDDEAQQKSETANTFVAQVVALGKECAVAPTTPSALDVQEGGSHYKKLGIQPVQYIHENGLDYFQGNVVKYVTRHKDKNGAEDIKKAIHYLNLILELHYGEKQ